MTGPTCPPEMESPPPRICKNCNHPEEEHEGAEGCCVYWEPPYMFQGEAYCYCSHFEPVDEGNPGDPHR